MGRIIAHHAGRFFLWSTVVDAPVSRAMSREEMRAHLIVEYGRADTENHDRALDRAEAKGTSSLRGITLDDLIAGNRAGANETEATLSEILALVEADE